MSSVRYRCLICNKTISFQDSRILCGYCGNSWPVVNGVPHFIKEAPYWGEVSQENMRKINEQIKTKYWKKVFLESESAEVRKAYIMISNLRKSNWHLLLDLHKDSIILDVGAGSGVLSEALSYHYAEVVALEPVIERIEFMKMRFLQEERDNITIVRGDVLNLPFPDSSFDVVVMNGVLEWVPLGDQDLEPKSLQMSSLKNLFRVLKPGGVIVLGTENRFLPYYFVGKADPHCGLPFVTILPRRLANIYSRKKTGKPYRCYLYSSKGYEKLLKACGFSTVDMYSSLPSYNYPHDLIPLKKNIYSFYTRYLAEPPLSWKRGALTRVLNSLGLNHYCGYAFIIFGWKS